MEKFAELLTKARLKKNMKKADVANLFGWTPMYYGRYENGCLYPTKNNIEQFAKFIGIDSITLLKIIEEERKI